MWTGFFRSVQNLIHEEIKINLGLVQTGLLRVFTNLVVCCNMVGTHGGNDSPPPRIFYKNSPMDRFLLQSSPNMP